MANTRKNTRGDTAESTDSQDKDMAPVRKLPRAKPRGRPPKAALDSSPSKAPKKEPVKRGRKKKVVEEAPLLLTSKVTKPTTTSKNALDLKKTPLLSRSASTLASANTSISISDSRQVSESDILTATDLKLLMKIINTLVTTEQDAIFEKYRQTTKLQTSHDSLVISGLRDELRRKQETIDALQAQLLGSRAPDSLAIKSTPRKTAAPELYQSPIRKLSSSLMLQQEDLANELKTIGITLDMQELLTGVRITNYEEDRDKFYFDVKQTSTNMDNDSDAVSVIYRLVIKKKFEQTAEVTYVPSFLQGDKDDDANKVSEHLPDYLRDNLIFPYNTLLQFYTKMNKALNKSAKT